MANRHFANFGDVWKHLPLAEVLRLRPPVHYWETHAGSATYPLTDNATRAHGALGFLSRAPSDPELATSTYLEALLARPGIYPGSPALAIRALGQNASYLFCDRDPESVRDLRAFGSQLSVRVIEADGVATVLREAGGLRVSPSDVFVHIDPYDPHERVAPDSLTPVELAATLADRGYRALYWYGYESMNDRGWGRAEISRLAPRAKLWCDDMVIPAPFVFPERHGVWGCGVVLTNPTPAESETCRRLGAALERICADDVLPGNSPSRTAFAVVQEGAG
jgi:23S rRNA A2030 N6-methylase RlmJ